MRGSVGDLRQRFGVRCLGRERPWALRVQAKEGDAVAQRHVRGRMYLWFLETARKGLTHRE